MGHKRDRKREPKSNSEKTFETSINRKCENQKGKQQVLWSRASKHSGKRN